MLNFTGPTKIAVVEGKGKNTLYSLILSPSSVLVQRWRGVKTQLQQSVELDQRDRVYVCRVGESALGSSGSEMDLKTVTESDFNTCSWCTVTRKVFRMIYVIKA